MSWLQALKCRIVGHMLPAMDDAIIKHTFDGKGCIFPICICKYQLSCRGFSELPWLVRQFGIATVEEAMRTSRDQKLIDAADDIEKILLLL